MFQVTDGSLSCVTDGGNNFDCFLNSIEMGIWWLGCSIMKERRCVTVVVRAERPCGLWERMGGRWPRCWDGGARPWAAVSLESNGQRCGLGDGCTARATGVPRAQNSPALGRAASPERKT